MKKQRETDRPEQPWQDDWPRSSWQSLRDKRTSLAQQANDLRAKVDAAGRVQSARYAEAHAAIAKLYEAVPELSDKPTLGEFLTAKLADSEAVLANLQEEVAAAKAGVEEAESVGRVAQMDAEVIRLDCILEDDIGAVGNEEQLEREVLAAQLAALDVCWRRMELENLKQQLAAEKRRKQKITEALRHAKRQRALGMLPVSEA